MKLQSFVKKITSLLLCLVMVCSYVSVTAQPGKEEYEQVTTLYDVHKIKPAYITQGLQFEAQYPGGMLVFPIVNAELQMGEFYGVEIYRLGGTLGESTVQIESIDYTAKYGVDYEIYVSPVKGDKAVCGEAAPIYAIEQLSYVPTLTSSSIDTEDSSGKDESQAALYNEYVQEFQDLIKPSSSFEVKFASGENSKMIYIKTLKDDVVTDDLEFTLTMKAVSGTSVLGNQNTMGFSITETREKPQAYIEVANTMVSYNSSKGFITVRRTGNTGRRCSYRLVTQSGTAVAGEDYNAVHLELDFLPGMTEHRIPFEILKGAQVGEKFTVLIENVKNAEALNESATVSFCESGENVIVTENGKELNAYVPQLMNVRDKEFVPITQFEKSIYTDRGVGKQENYFNIASDGKSAEMIYKNKSAARNNAISIVTKDKINFSGVHSISFYIDNYSGSCSWDHNAIYVSDSPLFTSSTGDYDFIHNFDDDGIGACWNMTNVAEDYIKRTTGKLKVNGEKNLYILLHKGDFGGTASFKIYSEGEDSEHNITLNLIKYNMNVVAPDKIQLYNANQNQLENVSPVNNVNLVHPQSGSLAENIDIYRNEFINISADFIEELGDYKPVLTGIRFCNKDGQQESAIYPVSGGKVKFTANIISEIQSLISVTNDSSGNEIHNVYVKPVYEYKEANVAIMGYNPTFKDSHGQTFKLNSDGFSGGLYVGGKLIGTVSWSNPGRTGDKTYMIGDTVRFVFTPESDESYKKFDLDLRYYVGDTEPEVNAHGGNIEAGNTGAKEVILTLERNITKIYPIVTELDLGIALVVKNPTQGNFSGKGEENCKNNTDGSATVTGHKTSSGMVKFDTLSVGNVLSLSAAPNDGYRAKWTYINTFTGEEHTYYGNSFFFAVQSVVNNNANVVKLEFEKITEAVKSYKFSGVIKIQQSTILNPADNNTSIYEIVENATVTIGNYSGISDSNGRFILLKDSSVNADDGSNDAELVLVGDEKIRALVFTNGQYFIADVNIADCLPKDSAAYISNVELKLNYAWDGPIPKKITAVNSDGQEQSQSIVLSTSNKIKFKLELDLSRQDPDKPVNAIKWMFIGEDGAISETSEETYLLNNAWYTEYSGVISELARHGDELWVELYNVENVNGTDVYTSFGRFNTGYSFQAATIEESIVYTPDVGVPKNITHPVPSIGPVNPTVSFYGLQPVFNLGSVGEDEYGNSIKTITIGISLSAMNDFMKEDKSFGTLSPLDKAKKLGEILGNYDECYNKTGKFPAFAGRKGVADALKLNTAVNFSPSIALCFQSNYYVEKGTGDWKFISTVYVLGFGGKLSVNIPFVFFYVPCFTNIAVELSLDICLCVTPNTIDKETGRVVPLDIDNLWDPNMSAVAGNYKIAGSITFGVGIGFNALIAASGNLKAALNIEFNSFNTGKGNLILSGGITVEFLFLKYSWTGFEVDVELFNNIDTQAQTLRKMRSKIGGDIMNTVTLRDLELEAAIDEKDLDVRNMRSAVLQHELVISKSPAMINPSVIEIKDGVYLATMVVSVEEEELEVNKHRLYYFIYDENEDKVVENGFVMDKYLEDMAKNGLRAAIRDNLDTDVQMVDCGEDILITWTKVGNPLKADSDNLDLVKNIGIATLYYNKTSGEFHDFSMITSDIENEVYVRPRIVYDDVSGLSQLFYEKLNVSTLTLDSTMKELQELPTTLAMRYNVLGADSYNWSTETEIAISENALKYFDVSNIKGRNVLAFVGSERKGFVLEDISEYEIDEEYINADEFNTKSRLYIQQFYLEDGELFIGKQVQITDDESVSANPRFAKVRFEDKENLLLFFKHNGDYAYQNINNIISQGLYRDVDGKFVLHEDFMEPILVEYDEDLSVNDDLMIISDNNTIYALWTTTEGEQQQIMARSLSIVDIEELTAVPKRNPDGSAIYDSNGDLVTEPLEQPMYILKGNWGGRTYLTEGGINKTEAGKFKKNFDAVVTKEGDLLVIFNAFDVDYSNGAEGIKNNNVVVSVYDTAPKYEINDSMGELRFSDNYPAEGETVKVMSLITNTGVLSGKNVKASLFANGVKCAENTYDEWLTADTKNVEFNYTLPYGIFAQDIKLHVEITENDVVKCVSDEYTFKTGDDLNIKKVELVPVKKIGGNSRSTVYKVIATVKNEGNVAYNGGKFIRIMDTDWKNLMTAMEDDSPKDVVVHTAYGAAEIVESLNPGEDTIVVYYTDEIPVEVFHKNAGGTAAYLEHYIINASEVENTTINANEEMSYVSMFYDGLTQAPYAELVEQITLENVNMTKGNSILLNVTVAPKTAVSDAVITYKSSDENVATVDSAGVVTAIGSGECMITAVSSNGVTATAKVTVTDDANSDEPGNVDSGDSLDVTMSAIIIVVVTASVLLVIKRKRSFI